MACPIQLTGKDLARPARELPLKVMKYLGHRLHSQLHNSGNWETVAEDLGYNFQDIKEFTTLANVRQDATPGEMMLRDWVQRSNGCTLYVLHKALNNADRLDCVEYMEREVHDKVIYMDLMMCVQDEVSGESSHVTVRTRTDTYLLDSVHNVLDQPIQQQYKLLDSGVSWTGTLAREYKGRQVMLMKVNQAVPMDQDPTVDSSSPGLVPGSCDVYPRENTSLNFSSIISTSPSVTSSCSPSLRTTPQYVRQPSLHPGTSSEFHTNLKQNNLSKDQQRRENLMVDSDHMNIEATENKLINASSSTTGCMGQTPISYRNKQEDGGNLISNSKNNITATSTESSDSVNCVETENIVFKESPGHFNDIDAEDGDYQYHSRDTTDIDKFEYQFAKDISGEQKGTSLTYRYDDFDCQSLDTVSMNDIDENDSITHVKQMMARDETEVAENVRNKNTHFKHYATKDNTQDVQYKMLDNLAENDSTHPHVHEDSTQTLPYLANDQPENTCINCDNNEQPAGMDENMSVYNTHPKFYLDNDEVEDDPNHKDSAKRQISGFGMRVKTLKTKLNNSLVDMDSSPREYLDFNNFTQNNGEDDDTDIFHDSESEDLDNSLETADKMEHEQLISGHMGQNSKDRPMRFSSMPSSGIVSSGRSPKRGISEIGSNKLTNQQQAYPYECLQHQLSVPADFEYTQHVHTQRDHSDAIRANTSHSLPTIADTFTPTENKFSFEDFEMRDKFSCNTTTSTSSQSDTASSDSADHVMCPIRPFSFPPKPTSNNHNSSKSQTLKYNVNPKTKYFSETSSLRNAQSNFDPITKVTQRSKSVPHPYRLVIGGETSRPLLDKLLANDALFTHYNTSLQGYLGWNSKETEYTINKTMHDTVQKDGYYILWYCREKKTLVLSLSHKGSIVNFRVHTKIHSDTMHYYITHGTLYPDICELLDHHRSHGLRHNQPRGSASARGHRSDRTSDQVWLHCPVMVQYKRRQATSV